MKDTYTIPRWIIEQAASVCSCLEDEFTGMTLQEIFFSCEDMGAIVFWGFYTDTQLQTIYK